ncbi:MAG: ribose 5-phosphate isomerase A [Thermoprotei archaeon]|nr:MAG: ribose 5-phosphate isomerase A [Thermoprotei archaeon]
MAEETYILKKRAAEETLKYIKDGMVIGLGSGSTVKVFIDLLGKKISEEGYVIYFISSSIDTSIYASSKGLKETTFLEHEPELAVDGADHVLPGLVLIKGGGGAFLREKIVDYYSKEYFIIVDETKLSPLRDSFKVPIEVFPQAFKLVMKKVLEMSEVVNAELRIAGRGKLGPVITDNGNFVLDLYMVNIKDWEKLEVELNSIPGVLENGVFAKKKPSKIFVGKKDGVVVLQET